MRSLVDAWERHAACLETDTSLFFPSSGEQFKERAAKAICEECAVRLQCLEKALRAGEKHGIWGGTNEAERRRIVRRRGVLR